MSLNEEKCILNMMSRAERGRGCHLQTGKKCCMETKQKNSIRLSPYSVPRVLKRLAAGDTFNCETD